jgi:uncharacterized protein (TIGR02246 family)
MGRMRPSFAVRILTAVVLITVAGSARALAQDARAAIESGNRQFEQAIAKGDAAAIAGMYTTAAQVLPPNSEPVQGREAIQKVWEGFLATGIRDLKLATSEATVAGDTAYEVGSYELKTPDGKLADRGKYVVVWKKEGGGWKLHRDIWNSSQPAPAR